MEALDTTALELPLPTIHQCYDLLRVVNKRIIEGIAISEVHEPMLATADPNGAQQP